MRKPMGRRAPYTMSEPSVMIVSLRTSEPTATTATPHLSEPEWNWPPRWQQDNAGPRSERAKRWRQLSMTNNEIVAELATGRRMI
jgi:hypothetical protein